MGGAGLGRRWFYMHAARITSAALSGVGLVLLLVLQFVPWASFQASSEGGNFGGFTFPGFDVEITATPWQHKASASGESDSTSWYDSDADDADGVTLLRTGAPIMASALAIGVVAALLVALLRGVGGPVLLLAAALLAVTATILISIGVDQYFGDADYNWHVGFYFGIFGSALLLGGAVAGFMAPRGQPAA